MLSVNKVQTGPSFKSLQNCKAIKMIPNITCACCGQKVINPESADKAWAAVTKPISSVLKKGDFNQWKDFPKIMAVLKSFSERFAGASLDRIIATSDNYLELRDAVFSDVTELGIKDSREPDPHMIAKKQIYYLQNASRNSLRSSSVVMERFEIFKDKLHGCKKEIFEQFQIYAKKYPRKSLSEIINMDDIYKFHAMKNILQRAESREKLDYHFSNIKEMILQKRPELSEKTDELKEQALEIYAHGNDTQMHLAKMKKLYEEVLKENGIENLKWKVFDELEKIPKTFTTVDSFMVYAKKHNFSDGAIISSLITPSMSSYEHIIPKSRYFDNSYSNKVICEASVNHLKDRELGYEFIRNHHGEIVGDNIKILSIEEYEKLVKENYSCNPAKMKKLLLEDIPDQFIERQLNDTRYISKFVKSLLSNIVREEINGEYEQEATSKNLIVCSGGVTDYLKKDWGVHDAWNRLILPRFVRMNEMTHSELYTTRTAGGHLIPHMPLEQQRGFSFKRIDHRHHAMDAIVTACTTRSMVNYLNNESACADAEVTRKDLQRLLCEKEWDAATGRYSWRVRKPWETFTQDVYATLAGIVVSFKQKRRVMTKTTGHYEHYNDEGKKVRLPQTKGDQHVVRKSLHKDTVYGEVNLRRIKTVPLRVAMESPASVVDKDLKHKLQEFTRRGFGRKAIEQYFAANHEAWQDVDLKRIPVYYFTHDTKERYFASRKPLDTSFDRKKIRNEITDTGIQQILLRYLDAMGGNPATAFTPEGIERMNRDITLYTGGKRHQPIRKVRVYEKAEKFAVGTRGNKAEKFVEAAKGTNLYYAIYETREADPESGRTMCKRTYSTIPLRDVVEQLKQGLPPVPPNDKGEQPTYVLSPGDLVYLPTAEERERGVISGPLDKGRIYKMVSSTGRESHYLPFYVSSPIVNKKEFESLNKIGRALTGEMIQNFCIPLSLDRLGNILGFKKECNSQEKPSNEQSHD